MLTFFLLPKTHFVEEFHTFDWTPCLKLCLRLENSYFAKKCKQSGGFFKCCLGYWNLETFEIVRNKLIREGLINDKITGVCKGLENGNSKCRWCSMGAMCSKINPATGFVDNTFYRSLGKGKFGSVE